MELDGKGYRLFIYWLCKITLEITIYFPNSTKISQFWATYRSFIDLHNCLNLDIFYIAQVRIFTEPKCQFRGSNKCNFQLSFYAYPIYAVHKALYFSV